MTRTVLFLLLPAAALQAQSRFAFREIGATSLELTENGKPVYVYNYGLMRKEGVPADRFRADYLHPVWAPGGVIVTDDFPRDHYHHRGISWMWPVVRSGGSEWSLWDLRGIRQQFVRWTARETGGARARLAAENGWYVGDRKVIRETVEIVAWPAEAGSRRLELTLGFRAVGQPVEIAGTSDQRKGYGGLSFRFAPRDETLVRTDSGVEARDTDMAPHPWAQMEGVFRGRRVTARVDINPSNPGFPNGWCLRHYGFLGVNFPGLVSYMIGPAKPLVLKYRVTLSSGNH